MIAVDMHCVQGKEWFGEDGVLIALPDPLKEISYRPPIVEEVDPALQTEYKKVHSKTHPRWTCTHEFGLGLLGYYLSSVFSPKSLPSLFTIMQMVP